MLKQERFFFCLLIAALTVVASDSYAKSAKCKPPLVCPKASGNQQRDDRLALKKARTKKPLNMNELLNRGDVYVKKKTLKPYSGHVFARHENSNSLAFEGFLLNGKPHGVVRAFFTDGTKMEETSFKHGLRHGPSTLYSKKGLKEVQSNYKNGLLHGPGTTYFSDETIKANINYKNGQKHGLETTYFAPRSSDRPWSYSKNQQIRWQDGQIQFVTHYIRRVLKDWPDGMVRATMQYRNGKPVEETGYHFPKRNDDRNGWREQVVQYKYQQVEGRLKSIVAFNKRGLKRMKASVKADKLAKLTLFNNGRKTEEFNFNENGDLHGRHRAWYGGKLMYDGVIDKCRGKVVQYLYKPSWIKEYRWSEHHFPNCDSARDVFSVGEVVTRASLGGKSEVHVLESAPDGRFEVKFTGRVKYFNKGRLEKQVDYKKGKKHGRRTIYRNDGTKESECEWNQGKRGKCRKY